MCANIPLTQNTCLFWRKFAYLLSFTTRGAPDVRLVIIVLSCLNSNFPFLSTQNECRLHRSRPADPRSGERLHSCRSDSYQTFRIQVWTVDSCWLLTSGYCSQFEGVIATHKITASAPDRDLATVQGLRVGKHLGPLTPPIITFLSSLVLLGVDIFSPVCTDSLVSQIKNLFYFYFLTEIGCQLHHQQQRDSQQKRCSIPGCEATNHPFCSGWNWARHWRPPPHCVLCRRCHHQLCREGKWNWTILTNSFIFTQ